jgi:metallo-beta-lactamase family protein
MSNVALRFLGAAGNVTGSRFLIEGEGTRLLVDCGLYQEHDLLARNWDPFDVPPDTIDSVLLTHAHLDHSGYLPRLVRDGFRGRIHATAATAELAEILLKDSGRIAEEDAAKKRRRHQREGRRGPHPEHPLYTASDAQRVMPYFSEVAYRHPARVTRHIQAEFRDAGHILGAASILVTLRGRRAQRGGAGVTSVLFSGDVGRPARPLLRDPDPFPHADYVVVESTYGNRTHEEPDVEEELARIVNETVERGGNLVIPSFAVGRAQELLFYLKRLVEAGRIPRLVTFVDSPMATSVTSLYRRHQGLLDPEFAEEFRGRRSAFDFPGLKFIRSVEESKAINQIRGTSIIIAGSGMCTGGRIKHHLVSNIGRPESTILFVGYQASGTLGRHILRGDSPVRIFGHHHDVAARIEVLNGLSAHGDRDDVLDWLAALKQPPRRVFVVHGEPESSEAFAASIEDRFGWPVTIPAFGDEVTLT